MFELKNTTGHLAVLDFQQRDTITKVHGTRSLLSILCYRSTQATKVCCCGVES